MISLKKQRLLVIAPHPDDEVIGCGGLIQKIKKENGKVFVLFLTVADTKDFSKKGISRENERKKEIERVASFLKYDKYSIAFEGEEHHLRLDKLGQKALMDLIERDSELSIEKIRPTMVAFPSPSSYNQDHSIAARATHASLRPSDKKIKHFVPTVLCYEEPADIWTLENKQINSVFLSLTKKEMDTKIRSLELYRSQTRPFPSLRSVESLKHFARLKGAEISSEYAESFVNYRIAL